MTSNSSHLIFDLTIFEIKPKHNQVKTHDASYVQQRKSTLAVFIVAAPAVTHTCCSLFSNNGGTKKVGSAHMS